jgi:hypothetical protein
VSPTATPSGSRGLALSSCSVRSSPALSICDVDDPERQIEIRGTAEISDDPEGELIERLALRYTGASFAGDRTQRVNVAVTPLHYTTHV